MDHRPPFALTSPSPEPSMAHRRGSLEVLLRDAQGAPLRDTEVTVEQRSHAFAFGCHGFEFLPEDPEDITNVSAASQDPARMEEQWRALFTTATVPVYWSLFEPQEGSPATDRLAAGARWFAERGIRVKGHPLVWHTLAPTWLRGRDLDEVEKTLRARITREVGQLAGAIDCWDAINEVVIMPVFTQEPNAITELSRTLGRIGMIRLAFEQAREANPRATLLLNDFDLSTAYDTLIEGVLEAGIELDAIGLQSHMHQGYWGEEKTLGILERFSRYGLPLHLTETTLVSGDLMPPEIVDLNDHQVDSWPSTPEGEARQADELVRHYRTLLSHPSVEAVTYWGLFDRGAWLGAPAGLVREDGSPKPSYEALHNLIRGEWWTGPHQVRTDGDGRARLEGWFGEYAVHLPGGRVEVVELNAPAPQSFPQTMPHS
ncbi:endo-1,4-beta-xylanase [Ornithinimicrobium sp. Y1847]|uniref:endo-1,4-beta-xylanase n=1 Tax=unclassified Ornithinimicrobium TaxID=2615080 RepID=UPI003B67429C